MDIKLLLIFPNRWHLFARSSEGRESQESFLFKLVAQVKVDFTGLGKEV